MGDRGEFLWAGFAKNESLYPRMSTKYKSSKLFWRILEDNKQNKRENWGKETLRICACKSPIAELCATCSWNGDDFLPVLPSLRFSPSNSCLFWWILSANSCLLVSNSIFLWESRKHCLRADVSYFLCCTRKRDVCVTPWLIVFQRPAGRVFYIA